MSISALEVLRRWASLGADLQVIRRRPPVRWDAAGRMIVAARAALADKAAELKQLLAVSQARLAPLDEPLLMDLGLHRWLAEDREEAYSDWLQWVVTQLGRADRVYRLFGQTPPAGWQTWADERPGVEREAMVPAGHQGHRGRLDLVIRYKDRAVIAVEVKVTGADQADTAKQEGYARWLSEQPEPEKLAVLLATQAEAEEYHGFRFCSWADVCVTVRQMVPEMGDRTPLLARALLLAFVAAVEQNLLRLPAAFVRQVIDGRLTMFDARVVDHLARAVRPDPLREDLP